MAKRLDQNQEEEALVDIIEVDGNATGAEGWIEKNTNTLVSVGLGVLLIIVAWMAYTNMYQQPRQQEAVEMMYKAQMQFDRDSFALALSNPGGEGLGFLEIIDTYGGTKAANMAKYYAGVCYLNLGKFADAQKHMSSFSPNSDVTTIMKNGVMGDIAAENGDLSAALGYYKKASNGSLDPLAAYYLKKVGMLEEKQGNTSAALEAYNKIKKDFPTSPVGGDIDKYIARVK